MDPEQGPVLRCKVVVERVTRDIHADGSPGNEIVKLRAVYGDAPENKDWSRWTPSAQFELTINNPQAYGKLPLGQEFFIDFTPAPKPAAAAAAPTPS